MSMARFCCGRVSGSTSASELMPEAGTGRQLGLLGATGRGDTGTGSGSGRSDSKSISLSVRKATSKLSGTWHAEWKTI